MPTYDYECTGCGEVKEVFHSMNTLHEELCSVCGKSLKRKISGGTGIIFKGAGFYVNDYKSSGVQSKKDASTTSSAPVAPAASTSGCGCSSSGSCPAAAG